MDPPRGNQDSKAGPASHSVPIPTIAELKDPELVAGADSVIAEMQSQDQDVFETMLLDDEFISYSGPHVNLQPIGTTACSTRSYAAPRAPVILDKGVGPGAARARLRDPNTARRPPRRPARRDLGTLSHGPTAQESRASAQSYDGQWVGSATLRSGDMIPNRTPGSQNICLPDVRIDFRRAEPSYYEKALHEELQATSVRLVQDQRGGRPSSTDFPTMTSSPFFRDIPPIPDKQALANILQRLTNVHDYQQELQNYFKCLGQQSHMLTVKMMESLPDTDAVRSECLRVLRALSRHRPSLLRMHNPRDPAEPAAARPMPREIVGDREIWLCILITNTVYLRDVGLGAYAARASWPSRQAQMPTPPPHLMPDPPQLASVESILPLVAPVSQQLTLFPPRLIPVPPQQLTPVPPQQPYIPRWLAQSPTRSGGLFITALHTHGHLSAQQAQGPYPPATHQVPLPTQPSWNTAASAVRARRRSPPQQAMNPRPVNQPRTEGSRQGPSV